MSGVIDNLVHVETIEPMQDFEKLRAKERKIIKKKAQERRK